MVFGMEDDGLVEEAHVDEDDAGWVFVDDDDVGIVVVVVVGAIDALVLLASKACHLVPAWAFVSVTSSLVGLIMKLDSDGLMGAKRGSRLRS